MGAWAEDEQRQAFTTVGEGEGVVVVPPPSLSSQLRVVGVGRG